MAATASTPTFRSRYGVVQFQGNLPTLASQVYNQGDLLYLDSADGKVKPFNVLTWNATLANTQTDVAKIFVGVCLSNKLATDVSTNPVLIAIEGVFQYDCAALGAAHYALEFVNADKDAAGNFLYNQTLAIVATMPLAIGRLYENAPSGATTMMVQLQSQFTNIIASA